MILIQISENKTQDLLSIGPLYQGYIYILCTYARYKYRYLRGASTEMWLYVVMNLLFSDCFHFLLFRIAPREENKAIIFPRERK